MRNGESKQARMINKTVDFDENSISTHLFLNVEYELKTAKMDSTKRLTH